MSPVLNLFRDLSYKEKSILISLLAVSGVYGAYFFELLSGTPEPSLSAMLAAMFGMVIALVVIHIIFHIVISLDDVSEEEDERDSAVNRRASVVGYNLLFVAVLFVTGRILIVGAWEESGSVIGELSYFQIANLLLASIVASEITYYAAQLFFYRRGLNG